MAAVAEHRTRAGGVEVFWRQAEPTAGVTPVLYLHGVPTNSDDWLPFLELTGGVAPDLPGLRALGQAGRLRLLDRRLRPVPRGVPRRRGHRALLAGGPRLGGSRPGHGPAPARAGGPARGHQHRAAPARLHVAPGGPDLAPGDARRAGDGLHHPVRASALTARGVRQARRRRRSFVDSIWRHFDHGTQRAILRLYRTSGPEVLEQAGRDLGLHRAPVPGAVGRSRRLHPRELRAGPRTGARARRRRWRWWRTRATGSGWTGPRS